jgi:hypothetical protein
MYPLMGHSVCRGRFCRRELNLVLEVSTAVKIMTSCGIVGDYQRFRRTYHVRVPPEGGGDTFLQHSGVNIYRTKRRHSPEDCNLNLNFTKYLNTFSVYSSPYLNIIIFRMLQFTILIHLLSSDLFTEDCVCLIPCL